MKDFGFFKGLPYDYCDDNLDNYRAYKNDIPREAVIRHIEGLDAGFTSGGTREIFTGEKMQAGVYWDGNFCFPIDFLHYYKNYDIGIPYDYEEYLKSIGVGQK